MTYLLQLEYAIGEPTNQLYRVAMAQSDECTTASNNTELTANQTERISTRPVEVLTIENMTDMKRESHKNWPHKTAAYHTFSSS